MDANWAGCGAAGIPDMPMSRWVDEYGMSRSRSGWLIIYIYLIGCRMDMINNSEWWWYGCPTATARLHSKAIIIEYSRCSNIQPGETKINIPGISDLVFQTVQIITGGQQLVYHHVLLQTGSIPGARTTLPYEDQEIGGHLAVHPCWYCHAHQPVWHQRGGQEGQSWEVGGVPAGHP